MESIDAGGRDAGAFADTLAAHKLTGLRHDQAGPWSACGAELEVGQDGRDHSRLGDVAPGI